MEHTFDSKYPTIQCGFKAILQPLAPNNENAFNPCFISLLFSLFSFIIAIPSGLKLAKYLFKPNYGSLSPKNTSFIHYIRCGLVLLHSILYIKLSILINIHYRYSDFKIISFLIDSALLLLLILPLHILETTRSPIQSDILLIFWPCFQVLQVLLLYQDHFTNFPVVKLEDSFLLESILICNAIIITILEASKKFWKPSHELKLHYMRNVKLIDELDKPNFYERVTFTWLTNLIVNTYKNQTLSESDLPVALSEVSAEQYFTKLNTHWKRLKDQDSQSSYESKLLISLIKAFGWIGLKAYALELLGTVIGYIEPQLLRLLIRYFTNYDNGNQPLLKGALISISMFTTSCFEIYLDSKSSLLMFEVGLAFKASLVSTVYQKSLQLSADGKSSFPSGSIINLISVDIPRIQSIAQDLGNIVVIPTDLILCLVSLWSLLGKSSVAALIVLIISIPINTTIVKYVKRMSKTQMKLKDKRAKLIGEILTSIKSLKLYAWEKPMLARLTDIRINQELKNWKKIKTAVQYNVFVWSALSLMVSFSTLLTFTLFESIPLSPELVFPALSLLNMLSKPLISIPSFLNSWIEASLALERISAFLEAPDIDISLIKRISAKTKYGEVSVEVKDTTFLWTKLHSHFEVDSSKYALKDVNFSAKKGDLISIVGKVGSGKSSFLAALMGELYAQHSSNENGKQPSITISGSVAFAAQTPWISNASIKDNILFGHRYDPDFYKKTIKACQLLPDLKILPDGDKTNVGEKGISLSGGQKARLSLARAVYTRADVYFLDDILSAVDNHVGKCIIDQVLSKKGLLFGKTIILSTNSLLVLKYSDRIYLLKDGEIIENGTIHEAYDQDTNPELYQLLSEFGGGLNSSSSQSSLTELETKSVESEGMKKIVEDTYDNVLEEETDEMTDLDQELQIEPLNRVKSYRRASIATFSFNPFEEALPNMRTGPSKEISAKGSIKWKVYFKYAKACSVTGTLFFIIFGISSSIMDIVKKYFLKIWAEKNLENGSNKNALKFNLIYLSLGILASCLSSTKDLIIYTYLGINGSTNIHEEMIKRVIRSPMNFFERTPVGRIMNRFTNDISKIDQTLPRIFKMFFQVLVNASINLIVIGVTLPPFIIIMLILSIVYMYYQRYFVAISRELKRMASVSSSPILAHLQESLNGVDSIRAYNQVERFEYINSANIDFNLKSTFMIRVVNRWLAVRLKLMGALIVLNTSSLAIYSLTTSKPLSPGMVGFVMSYALLVTGSLSKLVRISAEVEANVVAVERCLEYSDLPSEEDEESLSLMKPPITWPHNGSLKFEDYSTRYAPNLDLVLRNVSLEIKSGEKIGVVGRTGAGKSSLTLALFRIIEPVKGVIEIDGLNVNKLFLYDLRHNLGIIPQDSQLFAGSIRQNLDPLGYFKDEEIWKALELAHLKDFVLKLEREQEIDSTGAGDKLSCTVSEGGSNFSAGQRQLICLARSLLSTSKILVLDEATAAVDAQTDKIIQATIRSEFKNKTIIAIAHRIDTVMDSDRILSLEYGEVKEFDTPENLLKNPDGIFYSLCKQGGLI